MDSQPQHPTTEELKAQIAPRQSRQHQYQDLREQWDASGASQLALTDPDRRSMKTRQGTEVCYNVQVAVDHQHQLIVAHEVTNAVTDQAQLATIAKRAKAALDADQLKVLADMGYDDGDEVKTCVAAGLIPYIPTPNTSANTHLGRFGKDAFVYEAQHDCSRCPAGQALTFRFETVEQSRHIRSYSTSACQACRFKPPCPRNQEHRRMTRWVHAYLLEEMQPRVTDHPEKVTSRKSLVEHPFGTMKRWMDHGYFLTRGLTRVRGEMRLTILVYNVKRVMAIIGVKPLIAAVIP